jgi:hypothetical protein
MRDYPSRKLQLARAVYKGELEAAESVGVTLLHSILSRQGERWQSFGENPEEYTDCLLLSRELMLKKGVNTATAESVRALIRDRQGHILDTVKAQEAWQAAFDKAHRTTQKERKPETGTALFLDDATCLYAREAAPSLAKFLAGAAHPFRPELEVFYDGWEYFVYGLIDEGIEYVRALVSRLKEAGITRLITLSGRSEYMLQVFYPKIGVPHDLECLSVLDIASRLRIDRPSYLYAGSFWTRYLGQSDKINAATPNEYEGPHPASEESEPLLKAPKRVNTVTVRQKPLCAEHLLLDFPESSSRAIVEDALEYIRLSRQEQIVVMEPWAYHTLKQFEPTVRPVYYLDILSG